MPHRAVALPFRYLDDHIGLRRRTSHSRLAGLGCPCCGHSDPRLRPSGRANEPAGDKFFKDVDIDEEGRLARAD
jgi:hypothetical protein